MNIDIGLQKFTSNINNKLKTLGVTTNKNLSSRAMILQRWLRACHFNLFRLRSIRHYLDRHIKIKLLQSHILSKTDYCNVLYLHKNKGVIKCLQKFLNAAITFICNLDMLTAITSFAKDCHFLPVKFRVMFIHSVSNLKCN